MRTIIYKVYALIDDLKLALIADLHGDSGKEVIEVLRKNAPDIIAICGDLTDMSLNESPQTMMFLKECVDISCTVLSLGNHDYNIRSNELKQIEKIGARVLNDSWIKYNDQVIIGGLTSAFYHKCEYHDPMERLAIIPEIDWLDGFEKEKGYKILLDHHPENYDIYTKKRKIDLILSGHNHGGVIRVLGKGLYARNQGFFPKYDGGIYDNRLIVSRGLSNTKHIPRLFNPTELVYIHLSKKNIKVG